MLTITAIAQLVVLGCTWVFGLFLFQPQSWHNQVLAYIFTALNCLQGLFLFVLHCLLNKKVDAAGGRGSGRLGALGGLLADLAAPPTRPQVRAEYRKWACVMAGNKYSEFASSSTATSHQTSRVRAGRGWVPEGGCGERGTRPHGLPRPQVPRPSESGM